MKIRQVLQVALTFLLFVGVFWWLWAKLQDRFAIEAQEREMAQLVRNLRDCRSEGLKEAVAANPNATVEQLVRMVLSGCRSRLQAVEVWHDGTSEASVAKLIRSDADKALRERRAEDRRRQVVVHVERMVAELDKLGVTRDEIAEHFAEGTKVSECP